MIVNTFHFNVDRRTILSSFSLTLMPCLTVKVCSMGQSIGFKKRKNSGNRSCTFVNNEIANNSSMSCCKIMMHLTFSKVSNRTSCIDLMTQKAMASKWVIQVHHATGYIIYNEKTQGFLKMADDRTGNVRDICSRLLSQSIAKKYEHFLCGYLLVIDWSIPIN